MAENSVGRAMGYIIGKAEGDREHWHGHVTAVTGLRRIEISLKIMTVAAEFRRLGLAGTFMKLLENISDKIYRGYFVDLFVRKGNKVAINFYEKSGYITYRTVTGYYSGDEDALDMRKALSRDVHKKSVVPLKYPVKPEDIEL